MSKTISPSEVSAHSSPEKGMYIIIDGSVYDVTEFVNEHPGGAKILKRVAGKDASSKSDQETSVFKPSFSFFYPPNSAWGGYCRCVVAGSWKKDRG